MEKQGGNTVKAELPETGGHPGGQFATDSDSVASLKLRAFADLKQAIASFQSLQTVVAFKEEGSAVEAFRSILGWMEKMQ